MSFLVSPGIRTREIDLTGIVPAVSTSIGGYAGKFQWGPVGETVNLSNEKDLARLFGIPTKEFAQSYHTAASFLRYSGALIVARAINDDAKNASTGEAGAYPENFLIRNREEFDGALASTYTANFYARYPGEYGNSLEVIAQVAGSQTRYKIDAIEVDGTEVKITLDIDELGTIENGEEIFLLGVRSSGDLITALTTTQIFIGDTQLDGGKIVGTVYTNEAQTNPFDASGFNQITFTSTQLESAQLTTRAARDVEQAFTTRPGTSSYAAGFGVENDELHIMVVDRDGKFTGSRGAILETFPNVSAAQDAKRDDGASSYYKTVINQRSNYVFVDNLDGIMIGGDSVIKDDPSGAVFSPAFAGSAITKSFEGGENGDTNSNAGVYEALELFKDPEILDVNLLFAENDLEGQTTVARKLIQVVEGRQDCVAFISPDISVSKLSTDNQKLNRVLEKFNKISSTSFAVFDSSPVYVYDKYNDEYIWTPAAGHIAGLCARTDDVADAWFSPAGYNRGVLLGVAKLGFVPKQNHRDELYKSRVNPLVSFPGEGIILFGDKTAQSTTSAFDRINVRRLFIILRKAIAEASKAQLFEFNDEFTRAQFRNLVNPFLRDIQGRRGITDFRVVCDETNNPGEIIDSNRFVGDIYVKPARAINFISLNFVATRTDVEFEEIIGQF